MNASELVTAYLPYFPLYLTWLVGAILALVRWHRHPRVSLVMLVATSLFILGMLIHLVVTRTVFLQMMSAGWDISTILLACRAITFVGLAFNTTAYALLLVAVFGWRGGPAKDAEDEEPGPGPSS